MEHKLSDEYYLHKYIYYIVYIVIFPVLITQYLNLGNLKKK